MTPSDPPKILIVDDDEEWHIRLQTVLRRQGYLFETANDYLEAVNKLLEKKFDLALVNALLRRVVKPGWLLEWTTVLGIAKDVGTNVIVVTDGVKGPEGITDEQLRYISIEQYGAKTILFKSKVDLLAIREEVKSAAATKDKSNSNGPHLSSIQVLFLSATPDDQDILKVHKEIREIDKQIQSAKYRDRIKFTPYGAVRISDFRSYLLRFDPHIVHFSGHGTKSGEIVLEDDTGATQSVGREALKKLFGVLKGNIRCVLLNACFSMEQAKAMIEEIDCVIGMSEAIDDESAIVFSTAFYEALGFGLDIKSAFDLGCNALDLEKLPDAAIPQLLVKSGVDPTRIKFF